jgi:hypothetical protein
MRAYIYLRQSCEVQEKNASVVLSPIVIIACIASSLLLSALCIILIISGNSLYSLTLISVRLNRLEAIIIRLVLFSRGCFKQKKSF